MENDKITTMKVKESVKQRIAKFGSKDESYNDVLCWLVKIAEKRGKRKW